MVDVASMSQFLLMTADLLAVVRKAGGDLNHDFIRYVITRHEPHDGPQSQIVALLRSLFGDEVLAASVWKSTAIADAGLTKQSLYELEKGSVGRATFDRAIESLEAVNGEILGSIYRAWGGRHDPAGQITALYASTAENEKLAMANLPAELVERSPERAPAGPVRSMGLALDRMERESRDLEKALAAGAAVVELDPSLVDVSSVRDRLSESNDASFETFKQSIADRGQEVPILVRPHPANEGRYQVAYGHRRLRAAAALGRKVRAIVRELSDTESVIAQGIENSQRKDLSYIERALFAARLEDKGFERSVIIDALATDKGELSKLISVARAVPELVIEAIGPAPKAGRRQVACTCGCASRRSR